MALRHHRSVLCGLALAGLLGATTSRAHALQPLEAFLRAAKRVNHDNREASATTQQREAEVDVAEGRLYPAFNANGSYTRNQYEVALDLSAFGMGAGGMMPAADTAAPSGRLVIQPRNQVDGNLTLSVPLIDVAAWKRLSAAKANQSVSEINERATELDVETQVFRSYYQLLGQEAVLEAAKRTLDVTHKNLESVQVKVSGGTASELDVQRARAEIARAEGDVASANLAVVTARRQLSTATSIEPEPATEFIVDDLHEEMALQSWIARAGLTPRVQLAEANRRAADRNADAAEAAWYPTLNASAQERLTNATSFVGHSAVYLLQATLAWRLDATLAPSVRAQHAAAAVSAIRAERAERAAQDSIFQAWHQVRAAIEKSRAARAQVTASQTAAELARDRYGVGAATQLEVVQAQQEEFRAEVSRIQADTDLAYARAALRASSGQSREGSKP
jgi:outer membrane protein TolC